MSDAFVSAKLRMYFVSSFIVSSFIASSALACACGCGVFDVATSSMLPTSPGGEAFIEYNFMNQDRNWSGTSSSLSANNDDKNIKTSFFTAGAEYMFNREWGTEVEVPYWFRHFTTDTTGMGNIESFDHSALGDVRVKGIYSGFSPDMSTGVTFGFKLPTGDYTYPNFDRDTEIGSGSTDVLLGAYHMGNLAGKWNWFANAQLDQPVLITAQYRPGSEVDAVAGAYYNGWTVGGVKIAPIVQVIDSYRLHDRGLAADPQDSGYERVLFAPGVEVDSGGFKLYADIGLPVYQQVRGNQLVASELFTLTVSHSF